MVLSLLPDTTSLSRYCRQAMPRLWPDSVRIYSHESALQTWTIGFEKDHFLFHFAQISFKIDRGLNETLDKQKRAEGQQQKKENKSAKFSCQDSKDSFVSHLGLVLKERECRYLLLNSLDGFLFQCISFHTLSILLKNFSIGSFHICTTRLSFSSVMLKIR